MVGKRGGSRQKVAKKLLNSADEIGTFPKRFGKNCRKRT
jgi:hypothetical protein